MKVKDPNNRNIIKGAGESLSYTITDGYLYLYFRVVTLEKLNNCIILYPSLLNSFSYCLTYFIIF